MSSSKRKTPDAEEEDTPWKKHCQLDLDTLKCPICTEPFSPPVFQCNNGHTACLRCCKKMNTTGCPSCSLPIGRIRCLAIEKVIESLWVKCELGCATKLRFRDREKHERSTCEYRPINCPMPGCTHTGPMCTIAEHLLKEHSVPTHQLWETGFNCIKMGDSYRVLAVLVKAEEVWMLVSLLADLNGHKFTCESVWASKEVKIELTVRSQSCSYSMTTPLSSGNLENYLVVPRHHDIFFVDVKLMA